MTFITLTTRDTNQRIRVNVSYMVSYSKPRNLSISKALVTGYGGSQVTTLTHVIEVQESPDTIDKMLTEATA